MPYLQHFLPHRLISQIADFLANHQSPYLSQALIQYFIKRYPICFQEALEADIKKYRSFNDFFTRVLKPNVRPIDAAPNTAVSPADSVIAQMGAIEKKPTVTSQGPVLYAGKFIGGT